MFHSLTDKPSRAVITAEPSATVVAGQTVNLTCDADGNPAPVQFEWKLNGKVQTSRHRVLVISTATTAKSGTYSCKASNVHGNATGRKHITVMRKYTL